MLQAFHQFLPHFPGFEAGMQAREPVRVHGAIGLAKIARNGENLAAENVDDVRDLFG